MTDNTLTDTTIKTLDEQFYTAYEARNAVDAWDIPLRIKSPALTVMLDTLAARDIRYTVRYLQPILDGSGGKAYSSDYHEYNGLSGKYVIARFTVAMDDIVKYVERELE